MSFIGAGELEHKITQLQRQLSHKDHELNSIKNEQMKKQEDLEEAKRAKQTAEYKLRDEADRALKAENDSLAKTNELAQLKLKLSNLEASLTQTSEKLKKEEKDKAMIQDALDEALSKGSDGAAMQIKSQQARIKQLEDNLRKAEDEKDKLRHHASSGDSWGSDESLSHRERNRLMALQNENAELKTKLESLSPQNVITSDSSNPESPQKRSKPRASVTAADLRDLETQVDHLKVQLANTKREYDKAVNEKLAAEVSARKTAERFENEMYELNGELEYYRRSDGGVDMKQLNELKKTALAAKAEKEDLSKKLAEKERQVEHQVSEMARLEEEAQLVQKLKEELEEERQTRQQLEAAPNSESFVDEASLAKINALEVELAKFKAASTTGGSRSGDSELRQARRDLQKALRDKEYLESLVKENDELLAEKDEELARMRAAVPLPGSPSLALQAADPGLVAALEEEKAALVDDLEKQAQAHEEEIVRIEGQLSEKTKELEVLRESEQLLREQHLRGQTEIESIKTEHQSVTLDLQKAHDDLSVKEANAQQIIEQLAQVQASLNEHQAAAISAKEEAASTAEQLSEFRVSLENKTRELEEALQQRQDLEISLASRSHDDAEFDEHVLSIKGLQDEISRVSQELSDRMAVNAQLVSQLAVAEETREAAEKTVQELEQKVSDSQRKVEISMEELEVYRAQSKDTIESLNTQLETLNTELTSLEQLLQDKTTELAEANRLSEQTSCRLAESETTVITLRNQVAELECKLEESAEANIREGGEERIQLRMEKEALEEALQLAKKGHESKLAAIEADSQRALSNAQIRIDTLQNSIQDAPQPNIKDVNEIHKFEEKIGRLRIERDELRHNISFVQNERHFAVRAANAEKDMAIEEVGKARDELKRKSAICDRLQKEIQEFRAALAEKDGEIGSAIAATQEAATEKVKLAKRLADLEHELCSSREAASAQQARVFELESQLQAQEANLKRVEARAGLLQTELTNVLHHMAQSKKLSDRPESRASVPEEEDGDLPKDLAEAVSSENRRHSHRRSTSGMSITMLQNLQTERNLQAKIDRRDARITLLINDLSKAQANLTLLQSAQEETMMENTELEEEREKLLSELHEIKAQGADPEALQGTILALILHHRYVKDLESQLRLARETLRKSREAERQLFASETETKEKKVADDKRIAELEYEKTEVENQLHSAKANQELVRKELEDALASVNNLQSQLTKAECASVLAADSVVSLATVEAQIAEKEERIREIEAQNTELVFKLEKLEEELAANKLETEMKTEALTSKVVELEQKVVGGGAELERVTQEREQLLEELTAAEKALADGFADAEVQKETLETTRRKLEERLAQLGHDMEEKSSELEEVISKSNALAAELAAEQSKSDQAGLTLEEHQATISQLQNDISTLKRTSQDVDSERQTLRAQISVFEEKATATEQRIQQLHAEIDRCVRETEQVKQELIDASSQLEKTMAEKEDLNARRAAEMEQATEARMGMEKSLAEREQEINKLITDLRITQEELTAATSKFEEAVKESAFKQADIDNLMAENVKIKQDLAKAISSVSAVDEQLVADLKERIEDLEASLTQKTQEVDEADDQTREAFKANAKLERKVGKLQRQLDQAQLELNTALNKLMSSQPVAPAPIARSQPASSIAAQRTAMPPPPVSTSAPTQSPALSTNATRTAHIIPPNIFSPPTIPNSGQKRLREADDAESAPKPAEAIMLPPTSIISPRKPLGTRPSFTPQRGISEKAYTSKPIGVNATMASEKAVDGLKKPIDAGRNIFARPLSVSSDPIKRTGFPEPPTRTPFATMPRNAS
ncbi:hypothetical protein C367_04810 [Cryptococcus neoformans Ze90-1]|nr:hypothetical protein C367_04810 [Cryptococcus neoformans var. grubii Ze90-1]